MKFYPEIDKNKEFKGQAVNVCSANELESVPNQYVTNYINKVFGLQIPAQNDRGFMSAKYIKDTLYDIEQEKEKRKELRVELELFCSIAKRNKASFNSLKKYIDSIFMGRYVDIQKAEKTFNEFNKTNVLDANFFLDNQALIKAELS